MKISTLFLIAILFFSACQSEHKQTPIAPTTKNPMLITCDGVGELNINDTYAEVLGKAGKSNVTTDSVLVDGKFYNMYCTTVWKGTPREITINWQESKQPYKIIQNFTIDNPHSTYVLQNGIRIGSKLAAINKLNGRPLSLYGFGSKDRGTVVSFNGGNLDEQMPCVRPVFGMVINANDFQNAEQAASETGILPSDHMSLQKVNPIIVKLIINSKR